MQRRLFHLVGSLAMSVFASTLVVLALLTSPVGASGSTGSGPDAAGNGGAIHHGSSPTRPATAAYFSTDITGTHYVYVNNGTTPNSVSGYKVTSNEITPLLGSPYATGGTGGGSGYGSNQIAISPDHQCVFASDDGSGTFNSFQIQSDGSLLLVTHATVEGSNVQAIAVSPKGGVVFVDMFVSYTSGPLDSFSIGSGCAITEAQHIDTGTASGGLVVSKDGTKLFASSYVAGTIDTYTISGTSFSLLKSNVANPASPGGLATIGKYLYSGTAASGTAQTSLYGIRANGGLHTLAGSPATDTQGSNSAQVWYDHVDAQLVCSEQFSNSFGLFAPVNGTYTFLAHVTGSGAGVTPTAMTQIGRLLFVTNEGSGNVSIYKISRGHMTFIQNLTLPAVGNPNGIASF